LKTIIETKLPANREELIPIRGFDQLARTQGDTREAAARWRRRPARVTATLPAAGTGPADQEPSAFPYHHK
jgi:hypothetical protein